MNDYWDGPRRGVADVSGLPHIYESPFNKTKDDFDGFYLVTPINPELLALVLEDWDIWVRRRDAFDKGEVTRETHPALPEDRARFNELQGLIGTRLKADTTNSRMLRAEFRNKRGGWNGLEVQWSDCE